MSGGEKFKMAYSIANSSIDMAMSGFDPIGAISSVQDAISITRTIRAAVNSLSVSLRRGPRAWMTSSNCWWARHSNDSHPGRESGIRSGREVALLFGRWLRRLCGFRRDVLEGDARFRRPYLRYSLYSAWFSVDALSVSEVSR